MGLFSLWSPVVLLGGPLLGALASAGVVPLAAVQSDKGTPAVGQDPAVRVTTAPAEEARKDYRGRRIARTMHWRGAEWLLRETRESEEHTERMLAALEIEKGDTVCDLGCGNGYHTLAMARAVGAEGRVIGVDIQPEMLVMLAKRAGAAGIENITGVLGTTSNPKLEPASCDLILLADVYHEVDHPESVLHHARTALRPGGRLVLVEFRLEDPDVPIKPLHKMSKAQIVNELSANGFRFVREVDSLPQQHLMMFEARPIPADETPAQVRRIQAGEVARAFVRALRAADGATLEAFWGDEVVLLAGSELTAARWGGTGGEERVGRADLRRRYEQLLAAGAERWTRLFDPAAGTLSVEPPGGQAWAAPGDEIIEWHPGQGAEEPFRWVLRLEREGRWRIVGERADY